ncbi:MAG TPA: iron-sulfur cluster repair di-iron protein [Symbiobacteriaceae bacterium]|nr:iron-sulfur cluster repair di-iron protein [Symbiobacteriaceae bacterium]
MSNQFTPEQSIGEIVAEFQGASNLFKKYAVDFCCGGGRSLNQALAQKGIDVQVFLTELEAAYAAEQTRTAKPTTDWRVAPIPKLITRIVRVHHDYLRSELPALSAFTTKIANVHGSRHAELVELAKLFHELKAEMEEHMVKEEGTDFPAIQAWAESGDEADRAKAVAILDALEAEHDHAGRLLERMREITDGYALPADACRTYTLTFEKLAALEDDMFNHVHLENNILFNRVRNAQR